MSKPNTKTITTKDVNESKKRMVLSPILGYKVHTVTMHAEGQEGSLTKEGFEAFLRKIARPLKKDGEEKK